MIKTRFLRSTLFLSSSGIDSRTEYPMFTRKLIDRLKNEFFLYNFKIMSKYTVFIIIYYCNGFTYHARGSPLSNYPTYQYSLQISIS